MALYLLKFSGCLLIFLAFYKLVLEKENMHVFKRFFLLAALVLSISIPLVTFTQYIEPLPLTFNEVSQDMLITNNPIEIETTTTYVPYIIWSIYIIGLLIFGFKFIRNLYRLNQKIKHNPKQRYYKFTHVLLKDLIVPHTFFNYIFFNKSKFEANEIPEEVFWHEQTHATQKHSIDVVFIEALQVLLWFNPLIYIIKHAIKLNHEFLADQGVLQKGINTNAYQEIILAFSSNAAQPQLANAINYSLIKKRFTVMKTKTTKRGIWLRSIVLLPLLAVMLYSFSDTKVVEKTSEEVSDTNYTARSIDIEVFDNGTYKIDGLKATKNTFASVINQLHQDITPEIRNKIINVHVNNGKAVLDEDVWFIYNSVIDYGFHRIVTYNQEIIREKGNKPFAITNTDTHEQLNISLNEISSQFVSKNQDGASRELMKEYEKLAKHYNSLPDHKRIIKLKDVKRMKYIYGLMNAKQKKNAEPFPNIPPPPAPKAANTNLSPPPPPPIPENATKEQKEKYKKATEEYYRWYSVMNGKVYKNPPPPPPPPPPVPDNATPEQKKKYEENIKKYELAVAESRQNMAKVREAKNTERAQLIKVKEQYAAERKASQEVKLARVAEMKMRQEKLKEEKSNRIVKREAINQERKAQLVKEKLKYVEERKAETEKLKKEKLKHIEERKVLAEQKRAYKENIYAIVNNKQVSGVGLSLSIDEIKKLSITHKKHKVKSFTIMFPSNEVFKIKGNKLNSKAKSKIKSLKQGQIITVYEIENEGNLEIPPVLIEIKN